MPQTLYIHNARIWTNDPARPWADSITIRNGLITAIGIGTPTTPDATVIDACGRTITPGLIDTHLHLLTGGKTLDRLDLSKITSRSEFGNAIARAHSMLPSDQWLIANGWSQENWGGELPDKSWLKAAGERPVVCYRMDMHIALVNDAVLQMCDLTNEPKGGSVVRNPDTGEPTGLMIEAAAWQLVNPIVPEPSIVQRQQQLRNAQSHLHSLGVTAVGSMEYARDVQDVYAPLRSELTLRCRITLLDERGQSPSDPQSDFTFGKNFPNDDRLAVIGYKSFLDGTLGSRTACMLHDYADDKGNRGMFVELAARGGDALHAWARGVVDAGLSPSMHAIGDGAARLGLDVIDRIGTERRPRIEHAQQLDPSDIVRFRKRIASMQPLHKADDCRYVKQRMGNERLAGTFAFRSLADVGALLAFGSDWPVVSPDPLLGIRTAVTGVLFNNEIFAPYENLTIEEALRAYTSGAAFALGMDDVGIVREGFAADLVIFDHDPFTADWLKSPPKVAMTIAGGRVVYDASHSAQ